MASCSSCSWLCSRFCVASSCVLASDSVVEISGRRASGKTELLYRMLLQAALPATFEIGGRVLDLDGCGVSAVVIDMDGRFSCERLAQILDYRIVELLKINN